MNDDHHQNNMVPAKSTKVEYVKFALVILAILFISFAMYLGVADAQLMDFMRLFMGVFFMVFASFKLVGYKIFAVTFAGYDLIAKRSQVYAYAYPFIELELGISYLLNTLPVWRDVLTLAIMAVGAIGVYTEIKKRSGVHCACLGNVIRLPLSTVSFVENVAMGIMAAAMIIWRLL